MMAFSSTITSVTVCGHLVRSYGTFTNGAGDSGGNIDTGIKWVRGMTLTSSGAAAVADDGSVNETFPCDGSAVTVVNTTGADGYWEAWGTGL